MLLIFDWDGTLSDSTSTIVECMQKAAKSAGVRVCSVDAIRDIIGLGLPEVMQRLYPELGGEEHEHIRLEYVRHFLADDVEPSPFYPGVIDGLSALRECGHTLAVATGKSRRGLDRVFSHFDLHQFFDASRCADETKSKPDPLMLHELLEQFSCAPDQAIMIGDTEYDMDMACRASIARVGVSYGAHDVERLHAYSPDVCVNHFAEFVHWLQQRY